mmetsp:Transcript_10809/g.44283  ORF Transcript_10809/g.44283 Transcript_10809/m.44283 type:complete len:118 (-) Transcript_10809:498-851(-)
MSGWLGRNRRCRICNDSSSKGRASEYIFRATYTAAKLYAPLSNVQVKRREDPPAHCKRLLVQLQGLAMATEGSQMNSHVAQGRSNARVVRWKEAPTERKSLLVQGEGIRMPAQLAVR